MSLPLLLGALTLAPALCALLLAGLGAARFAFKSLALALCLIGLLLPVVLLFILYPEFSNGNPVFVGLFGGSTGLDDWFSAAYRIDGFGLYAAFGITLIVAPLLVWMAWRGVEGEAADAGSTTSGAPSRPVAWSAAPLARAQWAGVALALGIESTVLTVVFADNILWLALAWLLMVVMVWGIGELGSDLDTIDRVGLFVMVVGPLGWTAAMLVPAIGQHVTRSIYPRFTDMMGRGGFTPLQILIVAVVLTLAGAGFPFMVWMRRRALLVAPAGLAALALVVLPVALVVGARTYSAAQNGNSSWQEIGQTSPPITAGIWFCILGMLTICLCGLLALGRRDSRTLIAFLAISQVGWGLLALGAGDPTGMLGLVTLLATSLLGLGAMLAALFAGGTLTSDVEPDGSGPRPFGVPVEPIALSAWIVGALTLVGAPLFAGFISRQMISASIIHSRGLAVPLLGVSWAGDALLALALLRATAPAFTEFTRSRAPSPEDSGERILGLLPLAPAALLGLLAILVGAIPQVLLSIGGVPAASALVQAGAANAALTTSSIGYRLEAAAWLPSIAWLAIIVVALLVLFALPASLRDTKPVYLAGLEASRPEEGAELVYLPEPVETWSDLEGAFTSPWLLPLNEWLLRGIDEDFSGEEEIPEAEVVEDGEVEAAEPAVDAELPAAAGESQAPVSAGPAEKLPGSPGSAARPVRDRSTGAGKTAPTPGKPANMPKTTLSPGGSQSKKSGVKKGGGR